MSNFDKYSQAFIETFGIEKKQLEGLKYQDISEWDSVGHMNLMTVLEDEFDIEMDIDDITDFSSFEEGQRILKKYDVEL
ncbi:acyl carrier protein [Vibrio sinaloensis DSM 21326]|uniref:Acyl carrier protein n=1 Tax=Vibrio sinaloensis DSM 21326 TaxID=945550 RepID=E8M574_PHOS4|nr:acyl carrier protein [Vibrio sinaloensis]EGA70925.1 acyl carrier protein [Vibrio sinaloensis DSM 21326]